MLVRLRKYQTRTPHAHDNIKRTQICIEFGRVAGAAVRCGRVAIAQDFIFMMLLVRCGHGGGVCVDNCAAARTDLASLRTYCPAELSASPP